MRLMISVIMIALTCVASSLSAVTGPHYCGDEGTAYPFADITGPQDQQDCYVNLFDFALLASSWLSCSDPANPACDYLHLSALRNTNAVQAPYTDYVPHTTNRGVPLTAYDPAQSFFPIIMFGAVPSAAGANDWTQLKQANFNTVAPWLLSYPATFLSQAAAVDLQCIVLAPWPDSILNGIKNHPNLLGNIWRDEPIRYLETGTIETQYQNFLDYQSHAHTIAPDMRIFCSDWPNFTDDAYAWWVDWNTAGDVSCHKNFPITPAAQTLAAEPHGIPQSVTLAVEINQQQKPMWLVVPAFESTTDYTQSESFRFPTETQLRAAVYTGLIHGATGIAYYTWDNATARGYGMIGMAPDPQASYIQGQPVATPTQLIQSQAIWNAATQINAEITQLTPALLSPTATLPYTLTIIGDSVSHTPIRCLLKPDPTTADRYYLLTVNVDKAYFKTTFTFTQTINTVTPMFENADALTPDAGNQAFTIHHEPFQTRVFAIQF